VPVLTRLVKVGDGSAGWHHVSCEHREGYLLLELEVPFIFYRLDMYVSRPTCLLRVMSILCSIQELTMVRTNDHVCLTYSIPNPSVERMS
jgi:hypothetical protein